MPVFNARLSNSKQWWLVFEIHKFLFCFMNIHKTIKSVKQINDHDDCNKNI